MLHFDDLTNSIVCQVSCLKIVENLSSALRSHIYGLYMCVIQVFYGQLNSFLFVGCNVLNFASHFYFKVT